MSATAPRFTWRQLTPSPREEALLEVRSLTIAPAVLEPPPPPLIAAEPAVMRALLAVGVPGLTDALTPREDAIGLLQLAAEVEHALLVQYLFAAASVGPATPASGDPARRITRVAVQEMGHLVTVQNLLLAIGGPTCHHLGRDNLRRGNGRENPIPLVLESVSHSSLAKYVTVERPDPVDASLQVRVDALEQEAEQAAGVSPHRVGALYAAIYWLFQPFDTPFGQLALTSGLGFKPDWHLKPGDFLQTQTVDEYATTADEWGGQPDVIIRKIHDASEGCEALYQIMAQGEGTPGVSDSHFHDFLVLLGQLEGNDLVASPLPRTPIVTGQPLPEDPNPTLLTHPYTVLWAQLFNLRYTHLVLAIGHALFLPMTSTDRRVLIAFARDTMKPVLSSVTKLMVQLPVTVASGAPKAAPPFGLMDETLPDTEAGFWRRHRDLFTDEAELVASIRRRPEFDTQAMIRMDQIATTATALKKLLAGHTPPAAPPTTGGPQ